ncbi:retrovirus-related Pol polyprotein from transposon TNT 1-94 [Trifolium medium]|uniref:Retrovirus-related Pol polyprotein from transposon TNT 1-94 n=1 Tax=Trifolium medium TaxID=97028 RepID=A0A392RH68_9FABA|nr:retrovirus-related Pol polyprotein from transposon TNT 1-94 [Trifolium medium]
MAEFNNFMQPSIPKFDGFYDHWAMLMENLLRSYEYWNQIEDGIVVSTPNATAEQCKAAADSKLKDLKVKNYLFHVIDRSILETEILAQQYHDVEHDAPTMTSECNARSDDPTLCSTLN